MVVKQIFIDSPFERLSIMQDYVSSPEGRLWHAVLATYFVDASNRMLKEQDWISLLFQAQSEWTKLCCMMIDINHGFFIKFLCKVREEKKNITERFSVG